MLNQFSAKRCTKSCTNSDCGCKTTLNQVEATRGAGSICDHQNRDDAKDRIRHAIEELDSNQAFECCG